jgi:hypothetical protein
LLVASRNQHSNRYRRPDCDESRHHFPHRASFRQIDLKERFS